MPNRHLSKFGNAKRLCLFCLMRQKHSWNYFASLGKSTVGTILPSTNRIWLKAKQLQEFFCLIRQNKNFCTGGSGLDRTYDFQKFCGSGLDRIQFYRIRTGLGQKNFTVRSSLQCGKYAKVRLTLQRSIQHLGINFDWITLLNNTRTIPFVIAFLQQTGRAL